ncbi:hypothetical protein H0R92_02980 [Treponema sp. OMZ 840]|uniref:hypothetical protein n=1 Tax=Treponema sp. OMZ 840 TaxID=244313 RepID=UPI003D927207
MKKLCVWCISLYSILFLACNFGIKKDFAAVQIDFGASSSLDRALDSNSLPILSSAHIKIEAEGALSGYSVKELKPEDPKSVSLYLPIGDTVRIKVSVYNPSGIWSGSVTHTVEPGVNAVAVKLSKKISGLNKLLFTQKKTVSAYGDVNYDLTLYMDGKPITVPQSTDEGHIFARDSLGGLYVGYKSTSDKTDRYTSEGDGPESITLSAIIPITIMNDFTTGITYVVDQNGSVYEIEENAVNGSPLTTSLTFF